MDGLFSGARALFLMVNVVFLKPISILFQIEIPSFFRSALNSQGEEKKLRRGRVSRNIGGAVRGSASSIPNIYTSQLEQYHDFLIYSRTISTFRKFRLVGPADTLLGPAVENP